MDFDEFKDSTEVLATSSTNPDAVVHELKKEHELRIEVEPTDTISLKMTEGVAEIFGTEMASQRGYKITGKKLAVFTWYGCKIEIVGQCHAYIATETPMRSYLGSHSSIEEQRLQVENVFHPKSVGPKVVIVGPMDSGKTSLAKILLNYAVRKDYQPIFVDLDIGQNSITIPGIVAAVPVERPIDIEEGFSASRAPIGYCYGHNSLDKNPDLFKHQVENLAKDVDKRLEVNQQSKNSGVIINTCGWVDGLGYQLLLHTIETFNVDTVIVLDHERLYSDLTQLFKEKETNVMKLSKSGGVVTRSSVFRKTTRLKTIREYFYGPLNDLCPHSTVINFAEVVIYNIGGGPAAPSSALPIGATALLTSVRKTKVEPKESMIHSVLAVSTALNPDEILSKNVAGFLYVNEINMEKKKMTVIAPCPGPLPSQYLLLGSLKWIEV